MGLAPKQDEVLRQEVIFSSQRQERVDLVAIAVLSETDGSTATASELEVLSEGINRSELRRSCGRSRSYESSAIVSRAVISGYRVSSVRGWGEQLEYRERADDR